VNEQGALSAEAGPDSAADNEAGFGVDADGVEVDFAGGGFYALRATVAAHAADLGADGPQLGNLLLVVTELATNAVRYGGGAGRLRLWRTGDLLWLRVIDDGPGIPDPMSVGTHEVPLTEAHGRGLWLVRRLCHDIQIETAATDPGRRGTTVTAAVRLPQPEHPHIPAESSGNGRSPLNESADRAAFPE